jgi:hypothetical protein
LDLLLFVQTDFTNTDEYTTHLNSDAHKKKCTGGDVADNNVKKADNNGKTADEGNGKKADSNGKTADEGDVKKADSNGKMADKNVKKADEGNGHPESVGANIDELLSRIRNDPVSAFECFICNIRTTSADCLQMHLQGSKHRCRS